MDAAGRAADAAGRTVNAAGRAVDAAGLVFMLLLPTDACSAVTAAVARASASIAQCPACDSAVAPDNASTRSSRQSGVTLRHIMTPQLVSCYRMLVCHNNDSTAVAAAGA